MNCKIFLVMAITMTAGCATVAQTIYKSVGPDGKPVYSDKPPVSADASTTVVGRPAKPAAAGPSTDASLRPANAPLVQESTDAAERKGGAKKARPTDTSSGQSTPMTKMPLDPAVDKAMIGVMGLEDLVRQMDDLCTRTLPTSFKKYNTASTNWNQRNAEIVAQQRRVLADTATPAERRLIEAGVKAKTQQAMAAVINAPMASKIKWCDQSAEEINNGALDPRNKPNLSNPLMNYRKQAS